MATTIKLPTLLCTGFMNYGNGKRVDDWCVIDINATRKRLL